MAAALFLSREQEPREPVLDIPPVLLEPDGYYWFLYRYFESANINRQRGELIDLCDGRMIEGYQLHRLKVELEQALSDVQKKEAAWNVLVGWQGETASIETEEWQQVRRSEMIRLLNSILALVRGANDEVKLFSAGD